jgi:hypothetical protein
MLRSAWSQQKVSVYANQDIAMKPGLTTRALSLALQIYEGAAAAPWLLIGVRAVRGLIGLARMVPMHPSTEPQRGTSQSADGNRRASPQRTGSS